jgi:hypothetical protein
MTTAGKPLAPLIRQLDPGTPIQATIYHARSGVPRSFAVNEPKIISLLWDIALSISHELF